MVATPRGDFPPDMAYAASFPGAGDLERAAAEAVERLHKFARERPTAFGLTALGIGLYLGWKLKP